MERAPILAFGAFELDPGRFELRRGGARVDLPPTPLRLLLYLVEQRERAVPKEELLESVWPDAVVADTALSTALKELRRALGDDGAAQRFVHTLRGLGYRFVAPVEERVGPPSAPATAPPDEPARSRYVAVLPFKNLSPDPANDYFADGVTEDIITQVSKIGGLRVVSSTSSRRYQGSDLGLREIAQVLGAGTVLEGSIRREGSRIRIAAQLIDAATDTHLWAETYDREVDDIFEIQRDVACHIASALHAELTSAERRRLARRPTGAIGAYDHYLRGRELYRRWSRDDNEGAIQMYRKALEIDPGFALALAGLGNAYGLRTINWGFDDSWAEAARDAAERALAIDPDLAEAHKALGLAHMKRGLCRKSLECHLRAVELYPEYDEATHNIADLYFDLGQWDECLRWKQRHFQINPSPSVPCQCVYPHYLWHLGLDAEAGGWIERNRILHAKSPEALQIGGMIAITRGDLREARRLLDGLNGLQAVESTRLRLAAEIELHAGDYEAARRLFERRIAGEGLDPKDRLGFALCLQRLGDDERAGGEIEASVADTRAALQAGSEMPWRPRQLAIAAALRGDRDQALAWLDRAFDAGWRHHRIDAVDPVLQDLRGDPQFDAHLDRMRESVTAMRERVRANGWVVPPGTAPPAGREAFRRTDD